MYDIYGKLFENIKYAMLKHVTDNIFSKHNQTNNKATLCPSNLTTLLLNVKYNVQDF